MAWTRLASADDECEVPLLGSWLESEYWAMPTWTGLAGGVPARLPDCGAPPFSLLPVGPTFWPRTWTVWDEAEELPWPSLALVFDTPTTGWPPTPTCTAVPVADPAGAEAAHPATGAATRARTPPAAAALPILLALISSYLS